MRLVWEGLANTPDSPTYTFAKASNPWPPASPTQTAFDHQTPTTEPLQTVPNCPTAAVITTCTIYAKAVPVESLAAGQPRPNRVDHQTPTTKPWQTVANRPTAAVITTYTFDAKAVPVESLAAGPHGMSVTCRPSPGTADFKLFLIQEVRCAGARAGPVLGPVLRPVLGPPWDRAGPVLGPCWGPCCVRAELCGAACAAGEG